MKSETPTLKAIVVGVLVAAAFTVGILSWKVERGLNYRMAYEERVRQTIREMVREEALKK